MRATPASRPKAARPRSTAKDPAPPFPGTPGGGAAEEAAAGALLLTTAPLDEAGAGPETLVVALRNASAHDFLGDGGLTGTQR